VNLSSGGLAIVVVGALWFLVLLPSFIRGDSAKKQDYREDPVSRRNLIRSNKETQVSKEASEPTNSFKPSDVPSQNFLRTGAIEIVELAEVVSIETEKPETQIDSIDEILRRRRHVG
jgi:hypothetical protein